MPDQERLKVFSVVIYVLSHQNQQFCFVYRQLLFLKSRDEETQAQPFHYSCETASSCHLHKEWSFIFQENGVEKSDKREESNDAEDGPSEILVSICEVGFVDENEEIEDNVGNTEWENYCLIDDTEDDE